MWGQPGSFWRTFGSVLETIEGILTVKFNKVRPEKAQESDNIEKQ